MGQFNGLRTSENGSDSRDQYCNQYWVDCFPFRLGVNLTIIPLMSSAQSVQLLPRCAIIWSRIPAETSQKPLTHAYIFYNQGRGEKQALGTHKMGSGIPTEKEFSTFNEILTSPTTRPKEKRTTSSSQATLHLEANSRFFHICRSYLANIHHKLPHLHSAAAFAPANWHDAAPGASTAKQLYQFPGGTFKR